LFCVLFLFLARAQPSPPGVSTPQMPSSGAIERRIDDARSAARNALGRAADSRATPSSRIAPNLDALPAAPAGDVDLGRMARQFEALRNGGPDAPTAEARLAGGLLLFVSFALPAATLNRLIGEAERAGATLVLRGLVDASMVKTSLKIKQAIGSRRVGFQVDPRLFDLYEVRAVPAIVLADPRGEPLGCADVSGSGAKACTPTQGFAKVTGDVSLAYALEQIGERAPVHAATARRLRARLG
jgi:conjugal transfer pilus assembly protein TrbC